MGAKSINNCNNVNIILEFFISISSIVAENPNVDTEMTGNPIKASIIKALAITTIKRFLSIILIVLS